MKSKSSIIFFIILLILSVISIFVGVIDINIMSLTGFDLKILIYSRIPRILALIITGIGLSISGLILQKIFKNKFVSPSTGTTINAATLGIMISFIFMPNSTILTRSIFAFTLSVISTFIFLYVVRNVSYNDKIVIPLLGIMIGSVISSFTTYLAYKYSMTQALTSWSNGHFSTVIKGKYELIYLVLPLVVIAYIYSSHFNIVSIGKDISINLGVKYRNIILIGIILTSLISSLIVSTVGKITYIGLIVPNIISIYKGDNLKNTLIDISLLGSIFMVFCDILARIVVFPYEIPLNLIIGVLGSVIFIFLIMYRGEKDGK